MKNNRLAVLGGTFNPVHRGHIEAALAVYERMGPQKVLFIPSGLPPHKEIDECGVETADRIEMTRRAISPYPQFELCDIEIKRPGKSYTADTLTEIKNSLPEAKLILIMGTDMLLSLEQWSRFEDIFAMCKIAAVGRSRGDGPDMRIYARWLKEQYGAQIEIIEMEPVEISSTELRDMIRQGRDIDHYVPKEAAQYIKERGLYL